VSEENEDPTRGFMTRDAYDKEQDWEENKEKVEFPGYSYIRHTSSEYLSGIRKGSDGYAHSAMQLNIADLKGAMGEGSDYDDTALKRELEKQGKAIEANTDAIADKSDKDHTHSNITDPYDDSWIQPEIDKKSDKGHTHDISHNHDTEYQPVGDYADKNHLHNFDHIHDDYLTSDDLPEPYDDTQIRDDFAAADQNLQDQITIINDAGYDDSGIKLSLALEEEARIAGDDALSVKIDGKADDDHIHDPIDLTHNHNSQYQPIGDYATKTDLDSKSDTTHSHPPQDLTHDHDSEYQPVGNYAEKDHDHPPQDLTHNHDAEYAPVHEHPYSDKDHTHPPQDLTHNHDSDYQPVGDYATNQTVAAGDQDLQDQIDAISSSGGYNDSWIEPAINTGDANTLQGARQYTDEEVAKVFVPDVSDFATTGYVDAGDAAVEAKIPDVSNFATNQELTDGLAGKSDTTHDHDEFTHTHDFTHDHDGQYALQHNHPYASDSHTHDTTHDHFGQYAGKLEFDEHHHDGEYLTSDDLPDPYDDSEVKGLIANEESARVAGDQSLQSQIDVINISGYDDTEVKALIQGNTDALENKSDKTHTHNTSHNHPEYFPSGQQTDEDGNPIPLPYPDANSLGEAVEGKADEHEHPYVKSNADTDITPTIDDLFVKLKTRRPKDADGNFTDKSFGLAIDLDEGSTYKNQFEVGTSRNGYAFRVLGGSGREVWIGGSLSQKDGNKDNPNPENYIIRNNLNEVADEINAKIDNHTHDNLTQSLEEKANKSGDTFTGQVVIDKPANTMLVIRKDGETKVSFWADGTVDQHDVLNNTQPQHLVNRKNLTDAIDAHEHSEYFLIGDWSDTEYEPYANLREMDNSYTLLYEASQKAQQLTDGAQNRRLDDLEQKVANLEARVNLLDGNYPRIDLGTFTFSCDKGRPTGSGQTVGVAGIYHSKVADSTTSPVNEIKLNNGNASQVNEIVNHEGPVKIILTQGEKTQEWMCGGAGWITGGTVLHTTATTVSGDDLVDGAEGRIVFGLL